MKKSDDKKQSFRNFFHRNGFYIALVVCVAAAAALSLTAVSRILTNMAGETPPAQSETDAAPSQPVPAPDASAETQAPAEEPVEEAAGKANAEPLIPIYAQPVAGSVTNGFSGGELVRSATMNDWRTHNGVDYAAAEGAPVSAVYSGEVVRAESDPLWGYVVEVKLDTGYTAVYANLALLSVKAGQRVSQGDALGTVGSTALLESGETPHLHFEIKSGDKYVDPASLY
ncbi:MAG: peptidoglycan DD-metalloendopeptidase family protein [Oscillospiraceae bacterium]|nr:peptidoglycan DD-metalloendopeptidase family protein [Oscillospiraceae bacterium]